MNILGDSAGFVVGREASRIVFAHKRTRVPLVAGLIASGLCLMSVAQIFIWASSSWKALALIGALATLFLTTAVLLLRMWGKRRKAPLSEFITHHADLAERKLYTGDKPLAPLSEIEIKTPFNIGDSTQGSMRWVLLRWPGGKARVYSANSKEAKRVASLLSAAFAD